MLSLSRRISLMALGVALAQLTQFVAPTVTKAVWNLGLKAAPFSILPLEWRDTAILALAAITLFEVCRHVSLPGRFFVSWRSGLVSISPVGIFIASFLVACSIHARHLYTASIFIFCQCCIELVELDFRRASSRRSNPRSEEDPISDESQDRLHRSAVLNRLETLVVDRTPIIALLGDLGDGKSSVLNLLKRRLDARTGFVTVQFSTWLPGDEETFVRSFFEILSERLNEKLIFSDLRRSSLKAARIIAGALPYSESMSKELFAESTLKTQTDEIRRKCEALPVHVVILLDEIDRTERPELLVLFKILRGLPELKNISYVCAFDIDSVARSIAMPGYDLHTSYRFLEKFFPVQVELPKIDSNELLSRFSKSISSTLERYNLLTSADSGKELRESIDDAWQSYIKRHITNLRRLRLFVSSFDSLMDSVGQDVHVGDALRLEILKELAPSIYQLIYRYGFFFYYSKWSFDTQGERSRDEQTFQKECQNFAARLFDSLDMSVRLVVERIIFDLFPAFSEAVAGKKIFPRDAEEAWRAKRIYHPYHFPKYFTHRTASSQVSASEFEEFRVGLVTRLMEQGNDSGVDFVRKLLEAYSDEAKKLDFMDLLTAAIDEKRLPEEAMTSVCVALATSTHQFRAEEIIGFFTKARDLILKCALALPRPEGDTLLAICVRRASSDSFASLLMFYGCREAGDSIDANRLKNALDSRLWGRYNPESSLTLFDKSRIEALTILYRWVECGVTAVEHERAYLTHEFLKSTDTFLKFLDWLTSGGEERASWFALYSESEILELAPHLGRRALPPNVASLIESLNSETAETSTSTLTSLTADAITTRLMSVDDKRCEVEVTNNSRESIWVLQVSLLTNGIEFVPKGRPAVESWVVSPGRKKKISWNYDYDFRQAASSAHRGSSNFPMEVLLKLLVRGDAHRELVAESKVIVQTRSGGFYQVAP